MAVAFHRCFEKYGNILLKKRVFFTKSVKIVNISVALAFPKTLRSVLEYRTKNKYKIIPNVYTPTFPIIFILLPVLSGTKA